MTQNFSLKLKQTQQLNQRLQQSLRILQMSGLEIEREVEDWLQDNPLLERHETEEFTDADFNSKISAALPRSGQIGGDDAEDAWLNIAAEEDFNTYLHKQVCEHPLSEKEAAHVHILIDFLDEQGYFTDSLEDVIDNTPLDWMLDEDDLQNALDLLQTFDPPGVAAANLTESLMLQLMRLPPSPARQLAAHLIQDSLHELGKNRQQNIARFRKSFPEASVETIQTALDIIAALNPYPAYGFASAEPTAYVNPTYGSKRPHPAGKSSATMPHGRKSASTKNTATCFRKPAAATRRGKTNSTRPGRKSTFWNCAKTPLSVWRSTSSPNRKTSLLSEKSASPPCC